MTWALWLVGGVALTLWALSVWIISSPPSYNPEPRVLTVLFPALLAVGFTTMWLVLVAFHWL